MLNILFKVMNVLSYLRNRLFQIDINKVISDEPGLIIENLHSIYLSKNSYKILQARSIFPDGQECAGLGVDTNEKMALVKSLAEYFERKAVILNGSQFNFSSTNGVAAHKFKLLAMRSAYYELVERDAFLSHWYSRTPMIRISRSKINEKLSMDALSNDDFDTIFFSTFLGIEQATACFIVNKKSGGFVLGLSSGRGENNLSKAMQEAVINLEYGGYGKDPAELILNLEKNGFQGLVDHRSFWLYKHIFPSWLLEGGHKCKDFQSNDIKLKTTFVTLGLKPFNVVGAKNDYLLDLRLGPPTENDLLSLTRRVDFDRSLSGENLIHPIP